MTRKASSRGSIRQSARRSSQSTSERARSRRYLQNSYDVLVACGFSPETLLEDFTRICKTGRRPSGQWRPADLERIHDYPQLNTYWRRRANLIDANGEPRKLSFDDLLELIATVFPNANPVDIFNLLQRLRAIVQDGGQFLPSGPEVVLLEGDDLLVHGYLTAENYLESLKANTLRASKGQPRLLERSVNSFRFPRERLPELEKDMREWARTHTKDWDAKLERSEVPQGDTEAFTWVMLEFFLSHGGVSGERVDGEQPAKSAPSRLRAKLRKTPKRRRS